MPPLTPPPQAPEDGGKNDRKNEDDDEPWIVQWCLDGWHDARENLARILGPHGFRVRPLDPAGPSLAEQCRGAHVLVPTTATVDARCVAAALPALRLIAQPASAVGNIDLEAARAAGVPVTHAPGHNAAATAEVAVMLMLMLLRRAAEAPAALAAREVGRPVGREARGRTLGVVGITGRVGKRVARAAEALGMRVIGVDSKGRRVEFSAAEGAEEGSEEEEGEGEEHAGGAEQQRRPRAGRRRPPPLVAAAAAGPASSSPPAPPSSSFKQGLHALLEESDVVSLHIPLCAQTERVVGRDELRIMARRGALLVNTARAAVVDRSALEEALEGPPRPSCCAGGGGGGGDGGGGGGGGGDGTGGGGAGRRLAGAALDVMWEEPCDPEDPLLRHPRVVVLPHLGCASEEAYAALAGVLVRNIRAAREGRWDGLEHRVV